MVVKCNLADNGLIFCCHSLVWSSLKKIVFHSGYKRCTVNGVYDKTLRHVCLLKTNCNPRTDQDFYCNWIQDIIKEHLFYQSLVMVW